MATPSITELPPPPNRGNAPDVFIARADAFLGALPEFRDQANALAVYFDEQVATLEDIVSSAGYSGTSTSAIVIGTGSKSLFTQTNLSFVPGVYVSLADSAAPTVNLMIGTVTTYNRVTGAMTVNVSVIKGAGSKSAWTLSLSGPPGSDATVTNAAVLAALGYTPVNKTGDTFSGIVAVGVAGTLGLSLMPGDDVAQRGGRYIVRQQGSIAATLGYSSSTQVFLTTDAGRTWTMTGAGFTINGVAPYTSANDGSGSGLDADLLRGLAPSSDQVPSSVMTRDASGRTVVAGLTVASGGDITITNAPSIKRRSNTELLVEGALYLNSTLSASDITHRSDRRLKRDIEDLDGARGRLRPVSYILKETGEQRLGFIAQEVADVRPEAVRVNGDGILEIDTVALIAELSRQLNQALDRLDVLEGGRDAS